MPFIAEMKRRGHRRAPIHRVPDSPGVDAVSYFLQAVAIGARPAIV